MVGAGIAVVAIGLVVGGAAYAASSAAATTAARGPADYSHGPFMGGRMGAFQQDGVGMLGFGGKLHDNVLQAVAESLNLSANDLESKLADGQDLAEIAQEQGVAEEDLPSLIEDARSNALAAAVADGVLTQEQADWMSQHPVALRMLAGMRRGQGDHWSRGPMGWGSFGRR
jgi:hypothetical protein